MLVHTCMLKHLHMCKHAHYGTAKGQFTSHPFHPTLTPESEEGVRGERAHITAG